MPSSLFFFFTLRARPLLLFGPRATLVLGIDYQVGRPFSCLMDILGHTHTDLLFLPNVLVLIPGGVSRNTRVRTSCLFFNQPSKFLIRLEKAVVYYGLQSSREASSTEGQQADGQEHLNIT